MPKSKKVNSKGYNIVLSWSGPRSGAVAKAFREWLPTAVHAAKPWMSETDIAKGDAVPVQSVSDLVAAMTGRWVLCGTESIFAADAGDVGLEITADNHWYKLFPTPDGGTVRGAGWDEEGTWTALNLGDRFQVNFDISGSGTVITAPVFASTPRAMRLDNNGVFVGNYVIDATVPTGSVRCDQRTLD